MLKLYKYDGKTLEDCLNKAITELNAKESELFISSKILEGGLFKSKKCELEATLKSDVTKEIKEFLKELSIKMNIVINYEVNLRDDIYNIILVTENNSILIGKDGKTLNSIQMILKQYINNGNNFNIKISIDVSDYKARKQKNIEYEARKIAKEVISTHVDAKLDPMNSYERRLVHSIVNEFDNLETESIGEEPNRYVVIKFKED